MKNSAVGRAPGSIVAPPSALPSEIYAFAFDADSLEENQIDDVAEIPKLMKKWPMIWINVNGLADVDVIKKIGDCFKLHPLLLEDVMNIPQRPKTEDHDRTVFTVLRMVQELDGAPSLEQLSVFFGKGFVLTFQERPGDVFSFVRERLRKGGRRVKMSHADYMAYALLDAVVDGYFPSLERYGDRLDALEEDVLSNPGQQTMAEIHKIKRELHALRLCVWPMREVFAKLSTQVEMVRDETRFFYRDCQDHVVQILDIIENYRERTSGLTDLYLSSVSNKMNEVMKVLTIIATIFMPLGFLAGVYGMNFDTSSPYNMPELGARFGYPVLLGIMGLIALGMLLYFLRAGWLGRPGK